MSDSPLPPALIEAEARSLSARTRLLGTLGQVQEKLNPLALAQDAVENVAASVMRDTVETVRTRPKAMAAAAAVAVLFMARKPLARLLWKGGKHATAAAATSLKPKPKPGTPRAKKGPTP
jgi:hypothetical protein